VGSHIPLLQIDTFTVKKAFSFYEKVVTPAAKIANTLFAQLTGENFCCYNIFLPK